MILLLSVVVQGRVLLTFCEATFLGISFPSQDMALFHNTQKDIPDSSSSNQCAVSRRNGVKVLRYTTLVVFFVYL